VVTLKTGKAWNDIYATDGSISLASDRKDDDPGPLYDYKITMLIPKSRIEVEQQLGEMDGRKIVVKVTDKNSTIRLFGNMDQAMTSSFLLLLPGDVPGFNGYQLTFQGDFQQPALFIQIGDGDPGTTS
jgi:hypothetical protein